MHRLFPWHITGSGGGMYIALSVALKNGICFAVLAAPVLVLVRVLF